MENYYVNTISVQSYFVALQNNGLYVIVNSKIREAYASQEKDI
jgi:hypothetical protein